MKSIISKLTSVVLGAAMAVSMATAADTSMQAVKTPQNAVVETSQTAEVKAPQTAEVETPVIEPAQTEAPFLLDASQTSWQRIAGSATVTESGQISIVDETLGEIIVKVSEGTAFIDASTGAASAISDIAENDIVIAYVSNIMTFSLPPQTNGIVIITGAEDTLSAPYYNMVESVTHSDDGTSASALVVGGDMVLHIKEDAELMPYLTRNIVTVNSIIPGTSLLVWYDMVAESYPAQATPTRVVVLPYSFSGYVEINAETGALSVSEVSLLLSEAKMPYISESGNLMLPLRAVSEALGYEVTWNAETKSVAVKRGENEIFSIPQEHDIAVVDEDMVYELIEPAVNKDGVMFFPAQQLKDFLNFMLTSG